MAQKVAYVTGGMGGIGTAICQRLHKEGFKVIAGCGPTRDFNKWIDEQKALGYTFYASVGNVGAWESTVDAFTKAKAEHEKLTADQKSAGWEVNPPQLEEIAAIRAEIADLQMQKHKAPSAVSIHEGGVPGSNRAKIGDAPIYLRGRARP